MHPGPHPSPADAFDALDAALDLGDTDVLPSRSRHAAGSPLRRGWAAAAAVGLLPAVVGLAALVAPAVPGGNPVDAPPGARPATPSPTTPAPGPVPSAAPSSVPPPVPVEAAAPSADVPPVTVPSPTPAAAPPPAEPPSTVPPAPEPPAGPCRDKPGRGNGHGHGHQGGDCG
jgi:hypothetical protein